MVAFLNITGTIPPVSEPKTTKVKTVASMSEPPGEALSVLPDGQSLLFHAGRRCGQREFPLRPQEADCLAPVLIVLVSDRGTAHPPKENRSSY